MNRVSEEGYGAVEGEEVHSGGSQGDELGILAEPPDANENPKEKRDRQSEDNDVRGRERRGRDRCPIEGSELCRRRLLNWTRPRINMNPV